MTIAGGTDLANNQPKWVAFSLEAGSGKANEAANLTALYANSTHNSFISHQTVGIFGVNPAKQANTTGEGKKVTSPGWNLRRAGQGGLISVAVANGALFTNGDSATITGGTTTATVLLTTNATGNLVGATVNSFSAGLFSNTGEASITFAREKHLTTLSVTGTTAAFDNTDVIQIGNGTVNATATISTNATGGLVNGGITIATSGRWVTAKANTDVQITALAANGAASNGTGATFAAVILPSTGGAITVGSVVLGGRAGRVHYECLVENSSLISNNNSAANTILPE